MFSFSAPDPRPAPPPHPSSEPAARITLNARVNSSRRASSSRPPRRPDRLDRSHRQRRLARVVRNTYERPRRLLLRAAGSRSPSGPEDPIRTRDQGEDSALAAAPRAGQFVSNNPSRPRDVVMISRCSAPDDDAARARGPGARPRAASAASTSLQQPPAPQRAARLLDFDQGPPSEPRNEARSCSPRRGCSGVAASRADEFFRRTARETAVRPLLIPPNVRRGIALRAAPPRLHAARPKAKPLRNRDSPCPQQQASLRRYRIDACAFGVPASPVPTGRGAALGDESPSAIRHRRSRGNRVSCGRPRLLFRSATGTPPIPEDRLRQLDSHAHQIGDPRCPGPVQPGPKGGSPRGRAIASPRPAQPAPSPSADPPRLRSRPCRVRSPVFMIRGSPPFSPNPAGTFPVVLSCRSHPACRPASSGAA